MSQLKFGSPGVSTREVDLSGPVSVQPVGVPAGIIGTANQGSAFVPVTLGSIVDFYAKFGRTDGKKFGPLTVVEWLRNAAAVTYLRVMGVGDGLQRDSTSANAGRVNEGGFVVGSQQPDANQSYNLAGNPYANSGTLGSALGRLYFFGAFMSESAGSTFFSDAGLQGGSTSVAGGVNNALPIVRGIIMAPSGVILRLSSSVEGGNADPGSSFVATETNSSGSQLGSVVLQQTIGGAVVAKQEITMILNGHKGTDPLYPRLLTASFDMTAPNYFGNVFNTDPLKLQQAGHYLYASWDIHPTLAVVTGTGLIVSSSGAFATLTARTGVESSAFLVTSSLSRYVGSTTVPNYESFEDRYRHATSPWIISQRLGGVVYNLFRFVSLDAGVGISSNYKISIENISLPTDPLNRYVTFDVVVRSFADRDTNPVVLEQFRGVNIDPMSDRYVAKVIGDINSFYDFDRAEAAQALVVEGSYPNNSNLVRVQVSYEVDQQVVDSTAIPMGFRGPAHIVTSGSNPMPTVSSTQVSASTVFKKIQQGPVPYRKNITIGSGSKQQVNSLFYWGVQFEHVTDLNQFNASTLKNTSISSGFCKYFPDYMTIIQNFNAGPETIGAADTAANGIMDVDRFANNRFTLENVQVVTNSSGIADPTQWHNATYVRGGNVAVNDANKTRSVNSSDFVTANRRYLKFTTIMQGGFDGVNIFDNDAVQLNNNAVTADMNNTSRFTNNGPNVRAYVKAIEVLQNASNADIQLLAIPGIRHPIVTNQAVAAVEDRFDAMFVMDIENYDTSNSLVLDPNVQTPSVQNTVTSFQNRSLNSSFAAAYFPDVVITDPATQTNVFAPPSVAVMGALALNDAVGYPWFAPAGFTRGALPTVQEAAVKLSKDNMDQLYDAAINPLVAFPGSSTSGVNPKGGVVVWGQKTLQAAASALDRVNVRRLLIEIRRQVRDVARTFLFEPNRAATLARFSSAVSPKLQRIQQLAGLNDFRVIIDTTTTTQQDVENNTIRGKIFVQPTKTIEFVSLDFVVANNVAQSV